MRRAVNIAEAVVAEIHTSRPAFVFLERPPDTIYYQGRLSPGMIVARAQNVFKVIGVTYALYARLIEMVGMTIFLIDPVTWQERSAKKRDGLDIKDWSLRMANNIIVNHSDHSPDLRTAADENIADAISMGYLSYRSGLANC